MIDFSLDFDDPSGEPVPLWAEEVEREIAEEKGEEEGTGLSLIPKMGHSDEEAAVAILASVAALAFLFLSGKEGNNNAE